MSKRANTPSRDSHSRDTTCRRSGKAWVAPDLRHVVPRLCDLLLFAGMALLLAAGCTNVRPEAGGPTALARPVVVIGGIGDLGVGATYTGRWMKSRAGDRRVIGVSPGWALTFDDAAQAVVAAVERYYPSDDPTQTVPVDVIGLSMGGVNARHAAAPGGTFKGKRLNVARLYTISSPGVGAVEADFFGPLLFGTARAMRTGSPFMTRLADREQQVDAADRYPLVAYARANDRTVGKGVRLPPGSNGQLIWLPVPWWNLSTHNFCYTDGRILNDILRRLRDPH